MGEASREGMESPRVKPEPGIAPVQPAPQEGEAKEAPPEASVVYTHNDGPLKRDSVFLALVAIVAIVSGVVLALYGYGNSSAAVSILSFANTAVGALAGISYAQRGR